MYLLSRVGPRALLDSAQQLSRMSNQLARPHNGLCRFLKSIPKMVTILPKDPKAVDYAIR
jgi:hypothetical protein